MRKDSNGNKFEKKKKKIKKNRNHKPTKNLLPFKFQVNKSFSKPAIPNFAHLKIFWHFV